MWYDVDHDCCRSFARACSAAEEKIALVKGKFGDIVTLRGVDYAQAMQEEEQVT